MAAPSPAARTPGGSRRPSRRRSEWTARDRRLADEASWSNLPGGSPLSMATALAGRAVSSGSVLRVSPPGSSSSGLDLLRIRGMGRGHALGTRVIGMARTRESHEWTDEEVLRACREGQARAWREIVHRYTRLVLGIARAMGLQADDADEVFQLTFSTLFRSLARLRQPDRIEAWLVTASRRAALRLLRDRRRHLRLAERHAASAPEATAPPADVHVESVRERERAARALRSLAEPCRTL